MSLEEKQREWDNIKSGERHCWNYIDTATEDEDCNEIQDRLSDYHNRKQVILRDYKVCDCGKLSKKATWICVHCSKDFREPAQ